MNNINYFVHCKPYTFKHPPPYKFLDSQTVNVWIWWFVFIRPLLLISNDNRRYNHYGNCTKSYKSRIIEY